MQNVESAFQLYYNFVKSWETLMNNGEALFPKRVNEILNTLDQTFEAKQSEVATKLYSIVRDKLLQQDTFKKLFYTYEELKKPDEWSSYFSTFLYALIFVAIFTSYFEIIVSNTVSIVISAVIFGFMTAYKYKNKSAKIEKLKNSIVDSVGSLSDDPDIISNVSIEFGNIVSNVENELATVKGNLIEFYQQEQIDLPNDIQHAFLSASLRFEQFTWALLKTTVDLTKMVACKKILNCDYLGHPVSMPLGKLFHTFAVPVEEAKKLGNFLIKSDYFVRSEQVCQIDRHGYCYVFRYFSPFSETAKHKECELADALSVNIFNGLPVVVYWCDTLSKGVRKFENIKVSKEQPILEKQSLKNPSKLKLLFPLADPRYELAGKLLESMIAVASIDAKIGEKELETLISFSCQLKECFFKDLDIRSIFEFLILEIEPISTSFKLNLLGVNGVYFSKAMETKMKGKFLADFKRMINADGKVTENESKCFEILEKTILPS